MFTLQQMKIAHAKVKSGADFPGYVQEIKKLGVSRYEFRVRDGQTVFYGSHDFQIDGEPTYPEKIIEKQPAVGHLRQIIAETQRGKSDFLAFCNGAATAGVEKWVVDTEKMLCNYYDLSGNNMVAEPIPDASY
jgi:uncharacterized protein YbcV (DUF1398 family)